MRRDGIQHQMPTQREITVAADRFEVAADDAILVTELRSAIAVCVYDAVEEAGALLHLRCIVRSPKPADMTDSTLATELLLLDRCVESMRELAGRYTAAADPLSDIHNTRKIEAVVASGHLYDRAALDALLKNAEASAAQSPRPTD